MSYQIVMPPKPHTEFQTALLEELKLLLNSPSIVEECTGLVFKLIVENPSMQIPQISISTASTGVIISEIGTGVRIAKLHKPLSS